MQPIQTNLSVVLPNLDSLEDKVAFDPTRERFVLRDDNDLTQNTYIKGNAIYDAFHRYLKSHINDAGPETIGYLFSNLDQRIHKIEEPMHSWKGYIKTIIHLPKLQAWSEERDFLYAIQSIVKERMSRYSLESSEPESPVMSTASSSPSLELRVKEVGSEGSSPERLESPSPSPRRDEELERLRSEIQSLRSQILTAGGEEGEGPVRKPFPHTAAQLWVGCLYDELRKFDMEPLSKAEKAELNKILSELGISEYDGKGEVYRVKAFRSQDADTKTEAYCLRKLQNWLQNQDKLLINPDAAEGFTHLTDREMDAYFDTAKTTASNKVATRYGLPQRGSLKEVGLALWRAKALELAARHKLFNTMDLKNMNEKFYKDELKRAEMAKEEVLQKEQEKHSWNPKIVAPAATSRRNLTTTEITKVAPPKPPPPPAKRA